MNNQFTSSYTSLTAAPQGSSSGSIPPPGTIHWSGWRLLLTNSTCQGERALRQASATEVGVQKAQQQHARVQRPSARTRWPNELLVIQQTHVEKISHIIPVIHFIYLMQHERCANYADLRVTVFGT